MLTQCPHCLTLFRVGPAHLKAAAGDVRCCRCHRIFNALQSLQESTILFDNPSLPMGTDDAAATGDSLDITTDPAPEIPPEHIEPSDLQDLHEQPPVGDVEPSLSDPAQTESPDGFIEGILERDDGLDPEPDYLTSNSETVMSKLLDMDSSSILPPYKEEPTEEQQHSQYDTFTFQTTTAKRAAEESPIEAHALEESMPKGDAFNEEPGKSHDHSAPAFLADLEPTPELSADDDQALNFEAVKVHQPRGQFSLPWLVGSLLLLLPLAAQLTWQFRADLIQHTAGREALDLICLVTGCEVPKQRALDKIVITGRNLSTHPDKPRTLFLQVSIVNTATFEQPYPQLTLSLYNDDGNLIARRSFSASEYLPPEHAHQSMMPRAQPILVAMELVDPGKEVTGFSFDFY